MRVKREKIQSFKRLKNILLEKQDSNEVSDQRPGSIQLAGEKDQIVIEQDKKAYVSFAIFLKIKFD